MKLVDQQNSGTRNESLPDLGTIPGVPHILIHRFMQIAVLVFTFLLLLGIVISLTVTIDTTVVATGILEPKIVVPVRSHQTGVIQQVYITAGSVIRKGQVIARLDSLGLQNQLLKIETELQTKQFEYRKSARVNAIQHQQEVEQLSEAKSRHVKAMAQRRNSLLQYGYNPYDDSLISHYRIGSHIGIDIAQSDVISAQAEVQYHSLKMKEIDLNLQNTMSQKNEFEHLEKQQAIIFEQLRQLEIICPVSGLVLSDHVDRLVGSHINEGDVLIEVGDTVEWRSNLFVGSKDVHEIQDGASVRVEIQALPTLNYGYFIGSVTSVASEPVSPDYQGDAKYTGLYRVTVELDTQSLSSAIRNKLRTGYDVEGRIKTGTSRILDFVFRKLMVTR